MTLIAPATTLPDDVLLQLFTEHLEGIEEFAKSLEAPAYPVTDAARIQLARAFAQDVLDLLRRSDARADRASLVTRVNLSYEAMLILIDYAKTYTEAPKVPRSRRGGASPAST